MRCFEKYKSSNAKREQEKEKEERNEKSKEKNGIRQGLIE